MWPRAVQAEEAEYNYLGRFELGYKYQSMQAETIRDAYVETIGLNLMTLEWFPEEATWMQGFSWLSSIRPRFLYEFTPGNSAEQDQIVALSNQDVQAWERWAADMQVDLWQLFTGEPSSLYISYTHEVQSFLVNVQASRDYWYVEDDNARLLVPGDQINVGTRFVEKTLGLYAVDSTGLMGLGYFESDYNKPISTDAVTPLETIYEAEFIAKGMFISYRIGQPADFWHLQFRMDLGVEAEANILNGVSLSQDDLISGYNPTIAYEAYHAGLGINLRDTGLRWPLNFRVTYVKRRFEQLLSEQKLNDDEIVNFSANWEFTL
ncbi:hypothetical protein [Marinospirillum perlucidum]|uniref:hypothetical protein n=1 Tax=Marinospirillum perlucidum TaxID=1982602 RepID=UPI000DF4C82C|nr:hypothetical protein [Marinospirillum perlucidum]